MVCNWVDRTFLPFNQRPMHETAALECRLIEPDADKRYPLDLHQDELGDSGNKSLALRGGWVEYAQHQIATGIARRTGLSFLREIPKHTPLADRSGVGTPNSRVEPVCHGIF